MTHAERLREIASWDKEDGAVMWASIDKAALLAGAEALERESWKPIAEAPDSVKNGTNLLGVIEQEDGSRTVTNLVWGPGPLGDPKDSWRARWCGPRENFILWRYWPQPPKEG